MTQLIDNTGALLHGMMDLDSRALALMQDLLQLYAAQRDELRQLRERVAALEEQAATQTPANAATP